MWFSHSLSSRPAPIGIIRFQTSHWDREARRPATLVRAVELRSVDQGSPVMADDRVVSRRFVSITRFQNLVLKPARERDDAVLEPVLRQKRFAVFLILLGDFVLGRDPGRCRRDLFLLYLVFEVLQDDLDLGLRQERVAVGKRVLEALNHQADVYLDRFPSNAISEVCAESKAELFLFGLQRPAVGGAGDRSILLGNRPGRPGSSGMARFLLPLLFSRGLGDIR